jgi:hypothetical protein
MPSMFGIEMSLSTTSNARLRTMSTASLPFDAVTTS